MKKGLALFVLLLASSTPAWAYGGNSSFSDMLVHATVHGLVYGVIFKIMHQIGLVPSILLAVAGIGLAYLWKNRKPQKSS
jgi:hypothetical protein